MRSAHTTRQTNHQRITFESPQDIEVIAMAQLGFSTKAIMQQVNLTPGQITYRLTKGKLAEGYQPHHTYRSEWRNGTSPAAQSVLNRMLPGRSEERRVGKECRCGWSRST